MYCRLMKEPWNSMEIGAHRNLVEEFVKAIENDDYDHLLNSFEIHKGDFFYIPTGTIHAICSGSLIYEAQQSSDITYRVYDYHRKDADGNDLPKTVISREYSSEWKPGDEPYYPVNDDKNSIYKFTFR